ncbi:uncharacterized protein LOC116656732 [Camelus ferus]|uniref:Uncharacterized protein LOC116656732 n=1 Tax=Camelus ferus TaxID=419612 RepID=A0A8B8R6L8_CAMFR|nr:uncharacterized protein LOC116656732 [Camelus ferus]
MLGRRGALRPSRPLLLSQEGSVLPAAPEPPSHLGMPTFCFQGEDLLPEATREVLMALWKKLRPEQQYTPLPTSLQAREVAFADFLPDQEEGQGVRDVGHPDDRRPHVELTIHWSPMNKQRVLALVDTGAEITLVHGNPERFQGPWVDIEGYGNKQMCVKRVTLILGIGRLPPAAYEVHISPVAEYILGIDILQGLQIQTTQGEFRLRVRVVKTVIRGHPHHAPLVLPQATRVVNVRQYRLPGGHEEIGQTILKLEEAGIIRATHSPYNSPVWPVRKPDGSWRMTVDYRELNKVTPPMHAAVLNITDLMD